MRRPVRACLRVGLAAVTACALATGCATLQRAPAAPLLVTFAASPLPFTIEAHPGLGMSVSDGLCVVRRAEVQLREVRGDTVFFHALHAHTPAWGEPRCAWRGPGHIALAGQPQVRSETAAWSALRSLFVAAVVGPLIVLIAARLLRPGGGAAMRHSARLGALLAMAVLGSGCAAAVRRPALPPTVRLVSARMISLQPADTTRPPCVVRRAEVRVLAVRGDTIHFASATPLSYPTGAPRCEAEQPGWIALAEHPDLQVERAAAPSAMSLSIFWGTLSVLGLGLALLIASALMATT